MKTDDDAFVRVDEVMTYLADLNVTRGLLYGLINSDSRPHRDPDSKWYISPEVSLSFSFSAKMVLICNVELNSSRCAFCPNLLKDENESHGITKKQE